MTKASLTLGDSKPLYITADVFRKGVGYEKAFDANPRK
jgi:hypothetical protein